MTKKTQHKHDQTSSQMARTHLARVFGGAAVQNGKPPGASGAKSVLRGGPPRYEDHVTASGAVERGRKGDSNPNNWTALNPYSK
jgi:hypothetical protein